MSARPQSRGIMGPMGGGPVQAGFRPTTGMSGIGPMGGGPVGAPPGSRGGIGTRQGLGTMSRTRQGTAAQQPVIGVGALTDVKVADRPMTTQGLGMKTGSIGPKRQVYDKTYYMHELRKRCANLGEEVNKINKEINDVAQENELYQSLEKRYESLVKTVRSLEGDLADHNLATDKLRTDTQPEEVHHMYLIMKQQNEQQRSDVDQIFLEKRSHEEEIHKMHAEISAITRAAEERLNELHPDQRHEYEDLREENNALGRELGEAREELEQVSSRLNALEGHLRNDVLRARSQELLNIRKEASERLATLEQELRQCSMSVPEQRELLLSKVKTDNAEIVAAEKRNGDLKLEKERLRAQIKEVISDAQERRDEGGDQQKYEILFAKDQEMSQFIASFDDHKAEEEAKMREKQDNIVRLMENISTALSLQQVTPEGHLRDMEDELEFKSKQLQNSEVTQHRLEAELNKRQGELEKIESLDVKISQELQQVEAKMQQYVQDIEGKYDRISEMQGEGELKSQQLIQRKMFLEGRLSTFKQQVGFLRLRHEARKDQLGEDAAAAAIESQEQKIRQFGQTLFTLRSFIKQKSSESDYYPEMNNCLMAATEVNKILQERRPMSMSALP